MLSQDDRRSGELTLRESDLRDAIATLDGKRSHVPLKKGLVEYRALASKKTDLLDELNSERRLER